MLRVHLMQNWFALSDPAMEEALYEIASSSDTKISSASAASPYSSAAPPRWASSATHNGGCMSAVVSFVF
jgi:hypothetical protein